MTENVKKIENAVGREIETDRGIEKIEKNVEVGHVIGEVDRETEKGPDLEKENDQDRQNQKLEKGQNQKKRKNLQNR